MNRFGKSSLLAAFSLAATGCGGDLALPSPSGEVAGEPDTVRAVSAVSQPGRIGQSVPEDPVVLVLDRSGNPVGGIQVGWDVTTGGGSAGSSQTETGQDGRATVTWTLGPGIGVQKMTARVDGAHGSPATFTATVLF